MTKSKRGERGSSSSSASSNTELTKARMNEEEEETKSLKDLIDQLQSQARTNGDMSTCSREAALFYPCRSVLMWTGTYLFRGKNI